MRWFGGAGALALALIVAISGARRIGQREPVALFPLPAADGCWQGMCFFNMGLDDISGALPLNPVVISYGGAGMPNRFFFDVDYSSDPDLRATTGVALFATDEGYVISWDWRIANNPPLMRAGDLMVALGEPDGVYITASGLTMRYLRRGMSFTVEPSRLGGTGAFLRPGDYVRNIAVPNPRLYAETGWWDMSLATDWRGFGYYGFTG